MRENNKKCNISRKLRRNKRNQRIKERMAKQRKKEQKIKKGRRKKESHMNVFHSLT